MVKINDVSQCSCVEHGPFDDDQLCGLETSSERESVTKDYSKSDKFAPAKPYKKAKFDKYAKGN